DGPLPGRDRDRGAGPRAVRRGGRVPADAGPSGPAVRGAAAQRHRRRFRAGRRAAGRTTGQRPGAGERVTGGARVAGAERGAGGVAGGEGVRAGQQLTGSQRMAVREARIPVRDGTELAATLYLPAQPAGPVPALLEYLPYRKDDAMLARDYELYGYLAAHGY